MKHITCTSAIALVAALSSQAAYAQSEEGTEASIDETENNIVVTARRSDERLQDVPIAVAAFSGEALAQQRITTVTDLQAVTPGLTVRAATSSNQINYALRGQTIDAFSFSAPAVTVYLNEVPTGGTSGTALFDLESVQVLKGPQGTLFGRNNTGGAVLYTSKQPDSVLGGYLKGGYGNFNNFELEGAINLPISDGIALRVAGRSQTRDGFQTNILNGDRYNSVDSQIGRISLLIEPGDGRFSNLTVAQYAEYDGTNGALSLQNVNGVNNPSTYVDPLTGNTLPLNTAMLTFHGPDALGPGNGSSTDPVVNARFNGIEDFITQRLNGQAGGFYDVATNRDQFHQAGQRYIANTTTFEITPDVTIKNIFGWNQLQSEDRLDVDGSPYEFFHAGGGLPLTNWGEDFTGDGYIFGERQWSEELQVNANIGDLNLIVGGFMSDTDIRFYTPIHILNDLGLPYFGSYDSITDKDSKALYVQANYAVNDRLNVSGGFRYTWETVTQTFLDTPYDSLPTNPLAFLGTVQDKESKPSWLVGIDYKLTDDLLVYFNHRGSWRTGGFNCCSVALDANGGPIADFFPAETTYDFELGMKFAGYLGDVRAIFNLAVYDQYIEDAQRTLYFNQTANGASVAKARVSGVELDGTFELTDWLQVGGSFAYTDARYTDPLGSAVGQTFVFGPHADAPEAAGSFFVQTDHDLGDAGNLVVRGQFYSQSSFFYSNNNDTVLPGTSIDGYSLVNVRAELKDAFGSGLSLALYANNLFEEEYFVGGLPLGQVSGTNATIPGAPRMYGFELGVEF